MPITPATASTDPTPLGLMGSGARDTEAEMVVGMPGERAIGRERERLDARDGRSVSLRLLMPFAKVTHDRAQPARTHASRPMVV